MDERECVGEVACCHCATLDEMQHLAEQGRDEQKLSRIEGLRERHQRAGCLALGGEPWETEWSR